MAKSSALGVAGPHTAVLENLFAAAVQERYGFGTEAIAAVVEAAVAAEGGVLEPCSVGPIPGLHLASCLRPFPQTP